MTDYLELLLELRQDEEEAEAFVWKRTKVSGRGSEEDAPRGPEGTKRVGQWQSLRNERNPGEWAEPWAGAAGGTDLAGRLAVLGRAVSRGTHRLTAGERNREGTEWKPVTGGADIRRLRAAAPGVQRNLAAMLDTVFERDARRYDGPLGLF